MGFLEAKQGFIEVPPIKNFVTREIVKNIFCQKIKNETQTFFLIFGLYLCNRDRKLFLVLSFHNVVVHIVLHDENTYYNFSCNCIIVS